MPAPMDVGVAVPDMLMDVAPALSTVEVNVKVINPATGGGFSDVLVQSALGEAVTDASGQAQVRVNTGFYELLLDAQNARRHRVYGMAGQDDFQQITYLSPDAITGAIFGALGIVDDSTQSILVVGLDRPSLAPAIGAEASIDVGSDNPFVFQGNRPTLSNRIPTGGQGFVTFPNVVPGQVVIDTRYPEGSCHIFPAEMGVGEVRSYPGEVAVIAFTCRSD